jgi:hypothetical protein
VCAERFVIDQPLKRGCELSDMTAIDDHIHDVLSAILRSAVKWSYLDDNPARGVELPKLKGVRPKWVLTNQQAETLLDRLPPLAAHNGGVITAIRRPTRRIVRAALA